MLRFFSRRIWCAAAIAVGAAALSGAAPALADPETLEDALTESYATNPQILSERAHLRAVDEGVPQALSNWRPTVTFSGSAGVNETVNHPAVPAIPLALCPGSGPGCPTLAQFVEPSQFPPDQTLFPHLMDLNVTQPLYRGGRTVAQTSEAEKTIEAERARLIETEETVFLAVAQAYLDVVRDQATLDLSVNNEQLLAKQLESTQEQFRVGTLTRTDTAQAEASLASAVAARHFAEGNLQISRANYERAVGHLPPKLEPATLRPVLPATREEALSLAANKNPNVIAALLTEDAGYDAVKVIRGQLLPTVSLVGDYERLDEVELHGLEQVVTSGVVRMTMPLYEGGAVYSETRQAEQTVGQLKGQTDDARRAAVQSATQAWESIVSDRAQRDALIENVKAAEVAFEGTQQEQRVGTRTILDVLITEQNLFQARVNLVSTQHDLAVAEFNLASQIGRLTAGDLKLKVKLYDAETHYQDVRDKLFGFDPGGQ